MHLNVPTAPLVVSHKQFSISSIFSPDIQVLSVVISSGSSYRTFKKIVWLMIRTFFDVVTKSLR